MEDHLVTSGAAGMSLDSDSAERRVESVDPVHSGKSATNCSYVSSRACSLLQVHPGQPHEPGWLGGELDGKVGWFPETYVEKVTDQVP